MALTMLTASLLVTGCGKTTTTQTPPVEESKSAGVVNLYTSRHYESDRQLYDAFTEQTGIVVNVVEGKGDELLERLKTEADQTEADLFLTADAGNMHVASEAGLFQPVNNDVIFANIPDKYRADNNEWFGIAKRARVIVYAKDRVNPADLSTYEALTEPQWKGKVVARTSTNMYNMSLLASFIEVKGEQASLDWAKGLVANFARDPKGNDRDQAKAIVAGEADVTIMNTYYIGAMLNSKDTEEVKVAESVGIFFPNQDTTGTHVNISGIGVTKHAKNVENATKFIEFLSSEQAQQQFASTNHEYPVNPKVEPSDYIKSWGTFKEQNIDLSALGKNQQQAIKLFDQAGWK